jgi:hypothetical protein
LKKPGVQVQYWLRRCPGSEEAPSCFMGDGLPEWPGSYERWPESNTPLRHTSPLVQRSPAWTHPSWSTIVTWMEIPARFGQSRHCGCSPTVISLAPRCANSSGDRRAMVPNATLKAANMGERELPRQLSTACLRPSWTSALLDFTLGSKSPQPDPSAVIDLLVPCLAWWGDVSTTNHVPDSGTGPSTGMSARAGSLAGQVKWFRF